ncbi:hypothetical protein BT96DRAFT_991826 [Gymnopus androsaceus JB14]|uniref:Uncharacterized protein n=1 Tax=Gymnopus androsaceus JB14 TaxID=1447944 RepID=A0A6A4HUR4_9AGAR|nr:hypothetical protein BT96DRAFT_991826 [Gymnopus androsaceus JB14]
MRQVPEPQLRVDNKDLAAALTNLLDWSIWATCYMNATVQALRAISELEVALGVPSPNASGSTTLASGAFDGPPQNSCMVSMPICPIPQIR